MNGARGVRMAGANQLVDVTYRGGGGHREVIVGGGLDVHLHPSGLWVLYRREQGGPWRMARIPAMANDVSVDPRE